MTLSAALEQVADTYIDFGDVGQGVRVEILWFDGNEKSVGSEVWIGPESRCDFLGLALLDLGLRGFQGVIVTDREINGLIQRDANGCLGAGQASKRKRNQDADYSVFLLLHILSNVNARHYYMQELAGPDRKTVLELTAEAGTAELFPLQRAAILQPNSST
jgi:hypothetical protein